jgi:hypothetical protein
MERLWLRTGDESIRLQYRALCRETNRLITTSRSYHLSNRINSAVNCSQRWKELNKILHPNPSNVTPGLNENQAGFCETLSKFFIDKIAKLRDSIHEHLHSSGITTNAYEHDVEHTQAVSYNFTPVTPAEVYTLITSMTFKLSPIDSFPSSIIKPCANSFSIIISNIANLSFSTGRFPLCYKTARITPILKKPNLNPDDPSSYRPISNLNTISKMLERLALARLSPLIVSSPNFNHLQSAYRKFHSTETCLLKTLSDVYSSIDGGASALIVSLDLSAAFDTICHTTLIRRLEAMFGISGNMTNWISSYLSGRTQNVFLGGHLSTQSILAVGVPQGSVLGPLLFTSYIAPVASLVSTFGLLHQQYADDTQVYLSVSKSDPHLAINNLQACLSSLRCWFAQNGLAINPVKSEAILVSTAQRAKQLTTSGLTSVSVAGAPVAISSKITTLGLTIDKSLTFSKHVQNVSRSCMFHIRALKHIRHLLSQNDANTLATCLINSKLDYLNSALYDTTVSNINSLQRLQCMAARVVLSVPHRTPSSHSLSTLHWLPIKYRIDYKIACLTHSVLTHKLPSYLFDLIHPYTPSRNLRSSEQNLLSVPRTHLRLCDQSFAVAAPKVWNSLPLDLRNNKSRDSFRSGLKTHLYSLAFAS